ncbi:helix-turn-helix domain-containing protein [Pseudonocardia nematodicida]|uniref:Helix-turn-helix domain-containing protein n=1 Tax=Pseudonocardia nematodicida TaxID=1206997 RepID=A0ABV1KK41_9PSEU
MLPDVHRPPVAAATLRRLELASGGLAAACLAEMERRRPWFARLPAGQRAGVALVTQTGVTNFVSWLQEPERTTPLTAEAFRIAPRDLARRISLRQTVELVRIAADVFEEHLPPLAADAAERHELTSAVLRFGREIAFAAATVYAGAAESRGAWDARLEALVVDAVLRGDDDGALLSRAAALGWDPGAPVRCLVGSVPDPDQGSPQLITELRRQAAGLSHEVLVGVQGRRLVVLLHATPGAPSVRGGEDLVLAEIADRFGPGPVVAGPPSADLAGAGAAVAEAIAGLAAAPGHPDADRPVASGDLLPERALTGDPAARRRLGEEVLAPLHDAGGELLRTLAAYLEGGSSLEGCARALYVHPNTVRYRLRRVGELVGWAPTTPRGAFVLRTALVADRIARAGDGRGADGPAGTATAVPTARAAGRRDTRPERAPGGRDEPLPQTVPDPAVSAGPRR